MTKPSSDGTRARGLIQLESVQAHADTVLFRTSYDKPVTKYLATGILYVKYDFPIESVPTSILSIPLLGFLAPFAWLTGAKVRVGDVDEAYLNSLPEVAQEFKKMYPNVSFSGEIQGSPVRTVSEWDPTRYCLLYSRGVDSTTSLIRNLEKAPILMTVRGTRDLLLHEEQYWNRIQKSVIRSWMG